MGQQEQKCPGYSIHVVPLMKRTEPSIKAYRVGWPTVTVFACFALLLGASFRYKVAICLNGSGPASSFTFPHRSWYLAMASGRFEVIRGDESPEHGGGPLDVPVHWSIEGSCSKNEEAFVWRPVTWRHRAMGMHACVISHDELSISMAFALVILLFAVRFRGSLRRPLRGFCVLPKGNCVTGGDRNGES